MNNDILHPDSVFKYSDLENILQKIVDRTHNYEFDFCINFIRHELESLEWKRYKEREQDHLRRVGMGIANGYVNQYKCDYTGLMKTDAYMDMPGQTRVTATKPRASKPIDVEIDIVTTDEANPFYTVSVAGNTDILDFDTLTGVQKFLKDSNYRGVWISEDVKIPENMGFVTLDDTLEDDADDSSSPWAIGTGLSSRGMGRIT